MTGWTDAEATGKPLEGVFSIVNEGTRRPVENPEVRYSETKAAIVQPAPLVRSGGQRPNLAELILQPPAIV